MATWTEGYVSEIGYTFGYYKELNPLQIKFAFLNVGLVAPKINTACELGFGQGLSINLHAAASETSWYGNDFNPSQASFAQETAQASGADVNLYDDSFKKFLNRQEIPMFDYIGLHGIWSWISDENRRILLEFIEKKLNVGGVVYISYNCLPGMATSSPLRHLITEYANNMSSHGEKITKTIDSTLTFAEELVNVNPMYFRANSQLKEDIQRMKGQDKSYLAHEYFNRDWKPMYFSQTSKLLESAKLTYACSAHYFDHIDEINLSPDQQNLINRIDDITFKETVRDFIVSQRFRRDYWVKGPRIVDKIVQAEEVLKQRFVMVKHLDDVSLKIKTDLGEVALSTSIYQPILDLMADNKPRDIKNMLEKLSDKEITFPQLMQVITLMVGAGNFSPAQNAEEIGNTRKQTEGLNNYLIRKARGNGDITYLASPLTGGGILVGRFPQLFLLALSLGMKSHRDWAIYTQQILASQGQKLVKDGLVLTSDADALAELLLQAKSFEEKQLPILKALLIA